MVLDCGRGEFGLVFVPRADEADGLGDRGGVEGGEEFGGDARRAGSAVRRTERIDRVYCLSPKPSRGMLARSDKVDG